MLFGIFLLTGCKTKEKSITKAEIIEFNFDNKEGPIPYVSVEKIIPLEMTENSILSDIYGLKVKYFDNRYYILDIYGGRCLYAFNGEGLLINRTKTGHGPGELINPYAFDINSNKGIIHLFDQRLRIMLSLDLDLNILSSSEWDSIRITDFKIIDEDKVLVYHDLPTTNFVENSQLREYYQYTLYENNYSKSTRLNLTIFAGNPITLPNPFSITDEILLIVPRDYTVYKLIDRIVTPVYKFDFGKYMYDQDEILRLSDIEKEKMEKNGYRTPGMGVIQKTDKYLLCIASFKDKPVTIFHSLSSGINYNLNDCFDKRLIPECFTQCAIGQNKYLALAEPKSVIKFLENRKIFPDLHVTESDNPYLIIYSVEE